MKHPGIWLTTVVLALVVLLAQIAGASTREEIASGTTSARVTTEVTTTAATVSLPEQASAVAVESSAKGLATANESIAEREKTTISNEATVNAAAARNATARLHKTLNRRRISRTERSIRDRSVLFTGSSSSALVGPGAIRRNGEIQ